jgi:ABC-type branched-subunit amino acid transport system ATPase component
MDPILECRRVTKNFGGVRALVDLDFSAESGEILGLIGPNGSGKTTLFNVISGLQHPSRGQILFGGNDITKQSPDQVCAGGITRTFQNIRLFPGISVLDNVKVGGHHLLKSGVFGAISRHQGVVREEEALEKRALSILDFIGLSDWKDQLASALPFAHQRRLQIARALAAQPRLLLLDEPTAGMNAKETDALAEDIIRIKEMGIAIILVEHKMAVVMRLCHRIVVLNQGKKIADASPTEVSRDDNVIRAYLGNPQVRNASQRPYAEGNRGAAAPASALEHQLLRLSDVTASYGQAPVIEGVNLEIHQGEIACLLGANGAGKTTTIKAIMGLVPLMKGTIELHGLRLDTMTTHEIAAKGVAWIPEGRRVFARMTVKDNLEMGAFQLKDRSQMATSLERQLAIFPQLKDRLDQKAGSLSGGEQQMLAIARALMFEPTLVCMDEPSLGLSPIMVETVFDKICEINRQGTTIFLIEQNANMALSIANRGFVLASGKLILHGTAASLLENEWVQKAYLG